MTELLVLSDAEVRTLLPLDELASGLEEALIALSRGDASVPPRIGAQTGNGLLGAMPGYVPGIGLAAKLVSVFPGNGHQAVSGQPHPPSHQALIAVFDERTGTPLAVMDGAYITAIRTAMTAAVAARRLARPEPAVVAIIGAGVQGDAHATAFSHLLKPEEFRLASRDRAKAEELATRHPGAVPAGSFHDAAEGADIVCCCTDAKEAVIADEWIAGGTHVSSVGSGAELPAGLLARSRIFVESRQTVTSPRPAGAVELQGWSASDERLTEIGEVLAGRALGRTNGAEVTVFKSTGHAVEDLAAARIVVDRARALGVGTTVEMG